MKLRSPASRRQPSARRSRVGAIAVVVAIALAIIAFVIISTRPSSRADEDARATEAVASARVGDRVATTRATLSDSATHSVRGPVYRHSVIPGGVREASDVIQAAVSDDVVARHYADVDLAGMRAEVLEKDRVAYVSYRKGEQIYWTTRKVVISAGETILSNGTEAIRARCGNRISAVPLHPTSETEITEITELDLIDVPEPVAITTNAPVSVRPLPMDELFALARLLPDTDLTLLAPAGEPTNLGPAMLYGGGPGLLRGYDGVVADTSGSQTESTPGQTLETAPTPDTILLPPDNLLPGLDIPVVNKSPEPLPDVTATDVQQGPAPDKTPSGPPVNVPEPATWVLLGTGVALTFLRRRRSSRRG